MNVLIAGAGYVGTQLALDIVEAEPQTVVFAARRKVPADAVRHERIRWIEWDFAVGGRALPVAADAVYVTAAPSGGDVAAYQRVYGELVGNVVAAAAMAAGAAPRVVLTSSTSVYGQTGGVWVDEDSVVEPKDEKAAWIRRGEIAVGEVGGVALRLAGIYGPGRTSFLEKVRAGALKVNSRDSGYSNRVHRDDAAGMLRFLMGLEKPAAVYNGVDSACVTRAEVALWLAEKLGVALKDDSGVSAKEFGFGPVGSDKRVSNGRILGAGYVLRFPSYREGYGALI